MVEVRDLIALLVQQEGSDLHLTVGSPPQFRIDGQLIPARLPSLTADEAKRLCYSFLTREQQAKFEKNQELDLSFGVRNLCRIRVNMFVQKGAPAAALRRIPHDLPKMEELGLPGIVKQLIHKTRGLILVTSHGQVSPPHWLHSWTINEMRHEHILTIEDPIEFIHQHKNCIVNQREVGQDTHNFKDALKYVLRQDPDVVLIGELRDLETVSAALTIAETGHLVLGTLHTASAAQSITRIVDLFPPHQQTQVRAQLSFTLEAVVSQQLLKRAGGTGRVLVSEVLVATQAISNLIREDKIHQLYSLMQVGQSQYGMQTMNQSLFDHYKAGRLSYAQIMANSNDVDELKHLLEHSRIRCNDPSKVKIRRFPDKIAKVGALVAVRSGS